MRIELSPLVDGGLVEVATGPNIEGPKLTVFGVETAGLCCGGPKTGPREDALGVTGPFGALGPYIGFPGLCGDWAPVLETYGHEDVVGFWPNIEAYEAKDEVLELCGNPGDFGSYSLILAFKKKQYLINRKNF